MFSRGIATNQKQAQQEDKHDNAHCSPLVMVPGYDRYPENIIKAERTGHWNLHLQAVFDMLPYQSASGHHPFFLQANNSVLVNALWKSIHELQQEPSKDVRYVLDSGALLHRLPWPRGSTYDGYCF